MKYQKYISAACMLMAACALCLSCTDDLANGNNAECVVGEPVLAELDFGDNSYRDVQADTRSTQDGSYEYLVNNIYVLMFNATTGEKVYGKYFDIHQKEDDINSVDDALKECWAVVPPQENGTKDVRGYENVTSPSHGKMKIKVPSGGPFNLYVFSNIEARYLQLSPQVFDGFTTEQELKDYRMDFLGNPMFRTGMLMVGSEVTNGDNTTGGVMIDENGVMTRRGNGSAISYDNKTPLRLERMDAKVEVRVHIDPTKYEEGRNSRLRDFIPDTWEVVNVPNTAMLLPYAGESYTPQGNDKAENFYFNSIPQNFERVEQTDINMVKPDGTKDNDRFVQNYIFSFYMLENHQKAKEGKGSEIKSFNDRDYRIKDENTGRYAAESGDMWKSAPQWGTYLKITGKLEMEYKEGSVETGMPQTLFAEVAYYIHLGDFGEGGSLNDFNINRNTRYTYNISIVDVNTILVEVETSKKGPFDEPQPSAVGDVVVSKEKVAIFDAHYGQQVFRFLADYINDDLTWMVSTPFSKDGSPKNSPKEMLDYKWVHFFRNIVNGADHEDKGYEHYSYNNRWYPGDNYVPKSRKMGDRLMNVDELVGYFKMQKRIYNENVRRYPDDPEKWGRNTDFKKEIIKVKTKNNYNEDVYEDKMYWAIFVTAFVDEYYYDNIPMTGESNPRLWTRFVNDCGDRTMHILCDNISSLDLESSKTNSVSTIRQRAIQTPFTIDENLAPATAWGCETIDESGFDYYTGDNAMVLTKEETSKDPNVKAVFENNVDNSHGMNGLYNTYNCFLKTNEEGWDKWDTYLSVVVNPYGPTDGTLKLNWELPVNYDPNEDIYGALPQDAHFLNKDHRYLRYSFIFRNRDNNGDGKIDKDEVRWYVASLSQLNELYIGGRGISGEAQLYPEKVARFAADAVYPATSAFSMFPKWRHHIVSSTVKDGSPQILWAEEGLSTSPYNNEWEKPGPKAVRCVRNMGRKFSPDNSDDKPDALIVVDTKNRTIDARRVNVKSLRGGGELDANLKTLGTCSENDQFALIPLGFEVLDTKTEHTYEHDKQQLVYDYLKYVLDNGLEQLFPKPVGVRGNWRLPNVRELSLLSMYNMLEDVPVGKNSEFKYFVTSTYFSHGRFGAFNNDPSTSSWWAANGDISLRNINYSNYNFVFVRDWQPR